MDNDNLPEEGAQVIFKDSDGIKSACFIDGRFHFVEATSQGYVTTFASYCGQEWVYASEAFEFCTDIDKLVL